MSGILPTADELSEYRADTAALLEESPDRATITRRTRVKDTTGGYRDTTATVATDVPILVYAIQPPTRDTDLETDAGALTRPDTWEALLPESITVLHDDRITLDSGRAFEVTDTNTGETYDLARIVRLAPR